ncbi:MULTISPECIES: N-acetylneuraminate synthase family protein [unclassified Oceanispirochaeta]|uniref:N-acetylneuraminate synthase family protein n=1 Tax=unclassified Oceanispirochaeta TaxID=2635722 RepID=UPI001E4A7D80|nr:MULTISPECIES: N-acetylneuraminate synthase family protein [unclassified Oceanispirochaeta]
MNIIAEIGTAHGGSLSRAEELIRAAASSGADTAKFQIVFAREILHPETGTVPLPGGDTPLYEVFESLEKDLSFYASLKEMCQAEGLRFLASPFGMESAALLKSLNPETVKIASPEVNYTALLREVASWNIPVILSSGVSRMEDLKEAVDILGRKNLTLLHCVTSYPAPEEDYNLSVLPLLQRELAVPVGISDHSMNPSLVPSVAMLYGAVTIEKHFTLSRNEDGLDDPIALEPEDYYLMCSRVRELESLDMVQRQKCLKSWFSADEIKAVQGHGQKILAPSEKMSYGRTNRSIHASFTLERGTVLNPENCCIVRTEKKLTPGMHPRFFDEIMGRRVNRTIPSGEGISEDDLSLKL